VCGRGDARLRATRNTPHVRSLRSHKDTQLQKVADFALQTYNRIGTRGIKAGDFMGFKDAVAGLATRLAKAKARPDLAEEATKNAVVLPFLSALCFDVFDPNEVMPEYTADVGIPSISTATNVLVLFRCVCYGWKADD
jgi:hypothetical protein